MLIHLIFTVFTQVSWGQGLCGKVFTSPTNPASVEMGFKSSHLELVQTRSDQFGNPLMVFQQKRTTKKHFLRKSTTELASWSVDTRNFDRPGDLRWNEQYLSPALKKLLGFTAYNSQGQVVSSASPELAFLQVPSARSLIHNLRRLESQGRQEQSDFKLIHFYETSSDIAPAREYLQRLEAERSLPLSREGELFEHDVNFHVISSLVIPSGATSAILRRVALINRFDRFIQSYSKANATTLAIREQIEDLMLEPIVKEIDVNTGNMFVSIVHRPPNSKLEDTLDHLHKALYFLFREQPTPWDYLVSQIKEAEFYDPRSDSKISSQELKELLTAFRATLDAKYLEADLSYRDYLNPAEFYELSLEHFRKMEKAAENLLQK